MQYQSFPGTENSATSKLALQALKRGGVASPFSDQNTEMRKFKERKRP
jgi:hypothetical protein